MFTEANDGGERTPVEKLGEFKLIKLLTEKFSFRNTETILGTGDDAAILEIPHGQKQVVSTDFLCEGIHFNLGYVPLKHLGYKAAIVNFSDITAMNARPTHLLMGIAASDRFPVEAFTEIYDGIALACEQYGVDLIGGDTTSSKSGLILSGTAIGYTHHPVCRDGAKEHDLLVVSGDLGGAYMGLQLLEREHRVYLANPAMQPEMEGWEYVLRRQLKPEARTDVKTVLEELGVIPTSMIDVSDGLASEILHLSEQSQVGFRVYEEKIPTDYETDAAAEELGLNAMTAVMNGGEDYEILFTISQVDFEKIKDRKEFSIIGHATPKEAGNTLILRGTGTEVPLRAQGWTAF